jgi:hypothetical protein
MIYSEELLAVAKRVFCFGTPEEALEFPNRFLTYAMTYASDEDIEILRKYFSDDDFKATLDDPHPVFSTKVHRPNGMNVTTAPPFRLFRGDRFQVSIPPRSPIFFPPSLETGNVTTPSDRRYQREM